MVCKFSLSYICAYVCLTLCIIIIFTSVVAVRLVNSYNLLYEGRVEVYYNGTWGTICDDGWDLNDAEVVCKELGFGQAIAIRKEEFYGQGSGPIWLDDLKCVGTESSIINCSHSGWGTNDCNYSSNAGVSCATPNGNVLL